MLSRVENGKLYKLEQGHDFVGSMLDEDREYLSLRLSRQIDVLSGTKTSSKTSSNVKRPDPLMLAQWGKIQSFPFAIHVVSHDPNATAFIPTPCPSASASDTPPPPP